MVLDGAREDGRDLVVRARADDGVRGVAEVAGALPEQVGGRLAAGAQPPGLVVGEHVLGAEQLAQAVEQRRRDRRGGQRDLGGRGALVEAEGQLDQAAGGVGKRRSRRPGRPSGCGCISVAASCVTV